MRWDHFTQFPACNYTWTYNIYLRESESLSTKANEITNYESFLLFVEINPILDSILQDVPRANFYCEDEEQVEKVFDAYIYGELAYYGMENDEY